MGVLEQLSTGTRATLRAQHLVGRSRVCQLRLGAAEVSGTHAIFAWIDGRWTVRDLGSTNGTWLRSVRLPPREHFGMEAGSIVAFGNTTNRWRLISAAAPAPMAIDIDSEAEVCAEHQMLALPNAENPMASIFVDANGQWTMETEGDSRAVADLDVVEVDDRQWRLHLPDEVESTAIHGAARPSLSNITLEFGVSRDMENVQLRALYQSEVIDLGTYAHNSVLLQLAKRRQEDLLAGIPDAGEHGWTHVDTLARDLLLKAPLLNVSIHRARRKLSEMRIEGSVGVIERRQGSGQIRLGTAQFLID